MGALKTKQRQDIALGFRWRTRFGDFIQPSDMETRHLFHTVSMIWNHSMPAEAQTHDFKRYDFSPFYTPVYMRSAIRAMLPELLQRNDLRTDWRKRLRFMKSWFDVRYPDEPILELPR